LLSSEKAPFAAAGDFLPDAGDFFFSAAAAAAAPRVTRFLGGDGVVVGRLPLGAMAAGGGTTVAYALLFRQRTLRAPLRSCAGDCVGNSLVRPDGSIQSQAFFRFFKETPARARPTGKRVFPFERACLS
jgi:hypothetical protein